MKQAWLSALMVTGQARKTARMISRAKRQRHVEGSHVEPDAHRVGEGVVVVYPRPQPAKNFCIADVGGELRGTTRDDGGRKR